MPDPVNPNLATSLSAARIRRGLTLHQVADLTGLSVSHLSRLENGLVRSPAVSYVQKLADVYGLELEQLCPGLESRGKFAKREKGTEVRYVPVPVFGEERLNEAEAREVRRFLDLIRGKLGKSGHHR